MATRYCFSLIGTNTWLGTLNERTLDARVRPVSVPLPFSCPSPLCFRIMDMADQRLFQSIVEADSNVKRACQSCRQRKRKVSTNGMRVQSSLLLLMDHFFVV